MRRQRGIAVVTALLVTTLAVTSVTSLFWLQQVQMRATENQRQQLQSLWIMRGLLDMGRALLAQDLAASPNYTQLNGIWAQPLRGIPLDSYIDRPRSEGDGFPASASGRILDAQSRFNLANLAQHTVIDQQQVRMLERLLATLRVDPALALAVAAQVASGQRAMAAGGMGLPPQALALLEVEDLLAVSGFTPAAIDKLRAFLVALPQPTPLNVNTAPAELLAALVDNLPLEEAAAIVKNRQRIYYRTLNEFDALPQIAGAHRARAVDAGVKSDFFLALGQVRLDRTALDTQALLWRRVDGAITILRMQDN
ncbi:type II secretion system minor pseudopilin GspK [Duganella rivi]|nr:type II secretion system minor pseudopilin GspK [Duganella rivi]